MVYQVSDCKTEVATALDTEQLNEITEAILEGKYSWACFLLLRDVGYEPSEYIAYRTYYRLLKEHRESQPNKAPEASKVYQRDRQFHQSPTYNSSSRKHLSTIKDLAYLERVREQPVRVRGGEANQGFSSLSPRVADFFSKISGIFR